MDRLSGVIFDKKVFVGAIYNAKTSCIYSDRYRIYGNIRFLHPRYLLKRDISQFGKSFTIQLNDGALMWFENCLFIELGLHKMEEGSLTFFSSTMEGRLMSRLDYSD